MHNSAKWQKLYLLRLWTNHQESVNEDTTCVHWSNVQYCTNLASGDLLEQLCYSLFLPDLLQFPPFLWLVILVYHKLVVSDREVHGQTHSVDHFLHNILEYRSREHRLQFCSNEDGSDVPHRQLHGVSRDNWKRKAPLFSNWSIIPQINNHYVSSPQINEADARKNPWYVLITGRAKPWRFIVLSAVNIRTIIKSAIPFLLRSPPSLIHEVPVKTGERSVSCTLVL